MTRHTKRGLTAPSRGPRTFDEAFAELRLTPIERAALVWHLAAIRARKLVETLLPLPRPPIDPKLVLRADGETANG